MVDRSIVCLCAAVWFDVSYFNGFLLYAHDAAGTRHGTFEVNNPAATTNLAWAQEAIGDSHGVFSCEHAPASTITHNSAGAKSIDSLSIRWTAPTQNVGQLTWRGLVESSQSLQYTQVLTPWVQCPSTNQSCTAFDPNTLPSGPLPPRNESGGVQPFGLAAIDQSACGDFKPVENGAVPPGFCASVYATVNRPRAMYITDHGDMLVVETGSPTGVSVLRDLNGDGVIGGAGEYTRILTVPSLNHGLYVHNGYIYYSSPNTVWRLPFDSRNPTATLTHSQATVVVKNIPGGGHATRTPLVSHDNRWLYVSVGSAGNLDEDDSRSRVVRYDISRAIPSGGYQWNDYSSSAVQAFAKGLRNEVGLAVDLRGEVWGVMNADDNLNRPDLGGYAIHNDNPAERVDHLRESDARDGWYGYPFCWAADILTNYSNGDIFAWGGDGKDWYRDGEHTDQWCRDNTLPPSYALEAHTAPLGLVFYDGRGRYAFPPEYYNQLFVAEHGSWNSDRPRGYKVARIGTDEHGETLASTSRDFFAFKGPGAWWTTAANTTGPIRPVEVRVGPEGEMYVSSDNSGQIIVIRHINDRHTPVLMPQLVSSGYNYSTIGGPTKPTAEFSFDQPRTQGTYRWLLGAYPRLGVAQFDGASLHVNMTAADNNAGATSPNITGGNSTYEMWINVNRMPTATGSSYVVMELLQPGMTADRDDYIRILASVAQNGSTAQVWAVAQEAGQKEYTLAGPVSFNAGEWHHIALVLISQTMGNMRYAVMMVDAGTLPARQLTAIPNLMSRRSALLGHSHRFVSNGPLLNFTGYLDDVRLYSYVLSAGQIRLNYLLSATDRTNPVLQANLHMQPPENSEVHYQHLGPSNHYGPQPSANLFPGWIHLNGSQLVNLSNPMSGVGHAWRGDLFTASRPGASTPAMSLEFWIRLWDDQVLVAGAVLLEAQPLLRVSFANKQLQVMVGGNELNVAFSPTNGWTHIVVTASSTIGSNSYYYAYINGTSPGYHGGKPFEGGVVGNSVTLGGLAAGDSIRGLTCDIGAFRVYDFALNATHVQALFNAQLAEGRRIRQEVDALGQAIIADSGVDEEAATTEILYGLIASLAAAAVVVAVIVLIGWRIHKSRRLSVTRFSTSDGYSAELMSDTR